MKGIRGRYGQQAALQKDMRLLESLPAMSLFSEGNFNIALDTEHIFLIKPLFGPEEIRVVSENDQLTVEFTNGKQHFTSKEDAYHYLITSVMTKKVYIIQSVPPHSASLHYRRFTLHRKSSSASWNVVHSMAVGEFKISRFHRLDNIWRLVNFLKSTAAVLGKSFPDCHTIIIELAQNKSGQFWITDTVLHERNSKWSQYHALYGKRRLRRYIPKTDLCTRKSLSNFLQSFQHVILKPCIGQQGIGIVKVSVRVDFTFEVHEKNTKMIKTDFNQLFHFINEHYLSKKDYIVQQFIHLDEIDGNPYDVRVMSQLDDKEWIVTGLIVKVAAQDYFTSNRAGKLLLVEKALLESGNYMTYDKCRMLMERICRSASARLAENTIDVSIIGFDIGIDKKGEVWIIEANYAPSMSLFYMFDQNKMYKEIYEQLRKNKKRVSLPPDRKGEEN